MKTLGLLILSGFVIISCNQNQGKTELPSVATVNSVKDGMFIHITESYNDPHRVLMPLKMAVHDVY